MPGEKWEEKEEVMYLDLMKEGRRTGRFGERFKSEFFKECVDLMKPQFPHITIDRLNSKRAQWKSKWDLFLKLFNKTGYSFDEESGYFSAEPQNWKELRKSHLKECCWFEKNPMPYKRDLEEVFSKSMATGALARGRRFVPREEVVDPSLIETPETQVREEEDLMATIEGGLSVPQNSQLKRKSEEPLEESSPSANPSKKRMKQPLSANFNRTMTDLVKVYMEDRKAKREAQKEAREHRLATERQYKRTAKGIAVRHLQTEYSSWLSTEDMIKALRIVNEHAELFIELEPELQSEWLQAELDRID